MTNATASVMLIGRMVSMFLDSSLSTKHRLIAEMAEIRRFAA
jgi:hypothetical protein